MNLNGKTVLVTGANGFVGQRIAQRLLNKGAHVRALVRTPAAHPHLAAEGMDVVQGDITDAAAVQAAMAGVALVIHCAAVPGPDHETSVRINGVGTTHVVQAALAAGVERLLHISTVAVYDQAGTDVVAEDFPRKVKGNPYEEGKAAAETAVWAAANQGLVVTVIRPPAILGAHPTSTWCTKIARAVAAGKWPLVGDGGNTFAYVHVENLVDAVLLALGSDAAVGQAYNVIDGHGTWKGYTDIFRAWLDSPALPSVPPEQAPAIGTWVGTYDGSKIERDLGYQARLSFDEAMTETQAFLQTTGILTT